MKGNFRRAIVIPSRWETNQLWTMCSSIVSIDLLALSMLRLRDFFQSDKVFFLFWNMFFLLNRSITSIHHNRRSCLSTFAFFSHFDIHNRILCCQYSRLHGAKRERMRRIPMNLNNREQQWHRWYYMKMAKKLNALNYFCFYNAENDAITTRLFMDYYDFCGVGFFFLFHSLPHIFIFAGSWCLLILHCFHWNMNFLGIWHSVESISFNIHYHQNIRSNNESCKEFMKKKENNRPK